MSKIKKTDMRYLGVYRNGIHIESIEIADYNRASIESGEMQYELQEFYPGSSFKTEEAPGEHDVTKNNKQ